jgi:hypothetical protein
MIITSQFSWNLKTSVWYSLECIQVHNRSINPVPRKICSYTSKFGH